ncbi:MAG: efflux RND transporter periplasmic adaptor subunit [Armatimonadota bacterium]|nr:efflux RND transporter periplasmic adaptor subunit [Armatimonadota bacterium]
MRQHVWSILLLIVLLIVSNVGVRLWKVKHPGAMSIIEAQAMDMTAMKPPVGAIPVATEVVGRSSFSAKVTYTGSVAPYTEQNIYPRVEGWLRDLTVYNGDRVPAGKLLAVVDSPDLQTKVAEATAARAAAGSEIAVAKSASVRMSSEREAAVSEVQTARSEVVAAQARLAATRKGVIQAQSEVKAARANQEYWQAEIRREENLLKVGAVSKQEYQSEKAQAASADADADNKEAMLEEARANVRAAEAEVSSKRSMVRVASQRASAAAAAVGGSYGEIAQKTAAARQAGAMVSTAATIDSYRYLRARFAGIITKRYLSPGQLVNSSTAVLTIVQMDKVRLQANVADQDIARIRIGAPVTARVNKNPGLVYRTRVSSISPQSDQNSRTSVVEAIVDNAGHKLAPGDYVTMQIDASAESDQITVPSSAIVETNGRNAVWVVRSEAPKGKMTYYCTMHPEVKSDKPGKCWKCQMKLEPKTSGGNKKARLVYVSLGADDGSRTAVVSGLNDGDEVIHQGHTYLKEGNIVFPTNWGKDGPQELPKAPGMGAMPGMDHGAGSMPGMDHSGTQGSDLPPAPSHKEGKRAPGMDHSKMQMPKPAVKGQKTYVCPMHPEVMSHKAGEDCPKCGMKLEEKK